MQVRLFSQFSLTVDVLVVHVLMSNILSSVSDSRLADILIYIAYISNCSIKGLVYVFFNHAVKHAVG